MRTTDFSHAPGFGQANAMFVGATRFHGPLAMLRLYTFWRPMVRRLKRSPGYCGHRVWYRFPFTLGTMAFFQDKRSLLLFARSPEHAALMRWVMEPGHALGGFIRLHDAQPSGYSSGIWRAEEQVMRSIETYTPVEGEEVGPPVPTRTRRATVAAGQPRSPAEGV